MKQKSDDITKELLNEECDYHCMHALMTPHEAHFWSDYWEIVLVDIGKNDMVE